MAEKFVVGDIVQLKSCDGMKMTVFLIPGDGLTISCMWFNNSGNLVRESFPPEVLDRVERYPN